VDEEGQSVEPDLELLSRLLDQALGDSVAAIHWDLARKTLQAADGIPTVVGLAATLDTPAAPAASAPAADASPPARLANAPEAGSEAAVKR
jgi:hypothetical protein